MYNNQKMEVKMEQEQFDKAMDAIADLIKEHGFEQEGEHSVLVIGGIFGSDNRVRTNIHIAGVADVLHQAIFQSLNMSPYFMGSVYDVMLNHLRVNPDKRTEFIDVLTKQQEVSE
jgi:hypothetical protein